MTRILLDFPWQVTSLEDRYSDCWGAVQKFANIVGIRGVYPVPFIEPDEEAMLWSALGKAASVGTWIRRCYSF